MKIALLVLALVAAVSADMYLHNPRGSNNRLDEARRDRNNANRLFDSQNNNRGGYNVGSLYYYTGSILPVEWTNQHSCGDQNNFCDVILQYMCGENVRDGSSTNTIPTNPLLCEDYDCNTDLEFGMHETFDYYLNCRLRERNRGLFTADRNLQGTSARFTRQNNNGQRRGYECPEERDYYPYWHPTPWRDIAVLTNDVTRCPYYQQESANVKSRFACVVPDFYLNTQVFGNSRNFKVPNNQEACEELFYINPVTGNRTNATWTEFRPLEGLEAPECVESEWSRDNHLGNSVGGYPITYNWTVPDMPHEHCVLRIRYNISTADYNAWESSTNSSIRRLRNIQVFDDSNNNNGLANRAISEIDVASQFGLNSSEARLRGYVFRQNPTVKVFPDPGSERSFGLQLAINTNQFGRTFQDRSHTFAIRSRPADLEGVTIYNLNVRGKRGNIVQVYPGVEYDFVPNVLQVGAGDAIHMQWTGSNTNPNNNDGQGRAGTDRSNIVLLRGQNYPEGTPGVAVPVGQKFGHWGNSYPAHLNSNKTFLGLSKDDREILAFLSNAQYGGEMSELDDAGTYFDLRPRKVTMRGTYHYMCSRNNNFTNRSQKGKIIVRDNPIASKRIGWNGGAIGMGSAQMRFDRGDLTRPISVGLEPTNGTEANMRTNGQSPPGQAISTFYNVYPQERFQPGTEGGRATISIAVSDSSSPNTIIYAAQPSNNYQYMPLTTRMVNGRAEADVSEGGVFVVTTPIATAFAVTAAVVVILIIISIAIIGVVVYFAVRRDKWRSTKDKVSTGVKGITRSFAKKV